MLEQRVLRTIRAYAMIAPGERVLVAASGGADSTALLVCLCALAPVLGCELTVAHLNHCLRGGEADGDEAFVRRLSGDLGLPLVSEAVDVGAAASAGGVNLEAAAREARYAFLYRAATRAGAQKIAVGHNRNDQAETALFRFLRGSGIEGLAAMRPVADGRVIRPLLECTRGRILDYLRLRGAGYREDSSNGDLRYRRNRIRLELVPYLERHFNPRLAETLARGSAQMRDAWDFLGGRAREAFAQLSRPEPGGCSLDVPAVRALHPALQREVLRCALRHTRGNLKGISCAHIEAVLALCRAGRSGGRVLLPRNGTAARQFDRLLLGRPPAEPAGFSYALPVPGSCYVAEAGTAFRAEVLPGGRPDAAGAPGARAWFDLSVLESPLIVRSRVPGDRYGGPGHRKVKKMMIDRKIPLPKPRSLPLVVSGRSVIWIPGFGPAESWRARDELQPCVMIECTRHPAEAAGRSR